MTVGLGRRQFLLSAAAVSSSASVPSYLEQHATLYARDPHAAALEWFQGAGSGLFMHFGLYSMLGGEWQGKKVINPNAAGRSVAEWIQFYGRIPVAEYAKLKNDFSARGFDAGHITDVAVAAGMKYLNLTTRHHDSFCLFRTNETDFNSLKSPARRDLVAELASECRKKKLGLFLYYSHGRDWKHPHAPTLEWSPSSRPHYEQPQPEYVPDAEVDIARYCSFMERQITELLTQYGPVAGIWLDGEGVLKAYARKLPGGLDQVIGIMRLKELYAKIRSLQPQCLISYKQGVTMTEDFLTPERQSFGLQKRRKPMEICTTLQAWSWGYDRFTPNRKTPAEVLRLLEEARNTPANLLLNTGPKGDGSLVEEEERTLRAVGAIRRGEPGFPAAKGGI